MTPRYFATFISGCQEIVEKRLRQFPRAELVLEQVVDGLAIFSSNLTTNQLSELRFFNNVYGLIADLENQSDIDIAAKNASYADFTDVPRATFKLTARIESQPTALKSRVLQDAIVQKTGGIPDSFRPETEYLLWKRADGRTLFGWRLPRAGFKIRNLEPGELRPELAHIMGLLAGLDQKDIVLDPFAGYGAIVRECLQGFHCAQVIAVEFNEHMVPHLKSIPHLVAMHGDAAQLLKHVDIRSVDRVITDPPWGRFERATPEDLRSLYHESLIQMHRALRVKGCIVMLTGVDFLPEVAREIGFTIERQYNILVNGQKAQLYKLRKI